MKRATTVSSILLTALMMLSGWSQSRRPSEQSPTSTKFFEHYRRNGYPEHLMSYTRAPGRYNGSHAERQKGSASRHESNFIDMCGTVVDGFRIYAIIRENMVCDRP